MHRANLTIIAIPVLLLAITTVATPSMITEDVFAKYGRYGTGDSTSQAAAVSNECLNPILDSNTIDNALGVGNCGGTVSQQDESGSAAAPITHQSASPTIELQRNTGGGQHHSSVSSSSPQEPSPNSGTVFLTVNVGPFVDQLSFAVSTDAVSPTGITPVNQEQTLTFSPVPPSTFEVTFTGDAHAAVEQASPPCSVGGEMTITGNIPPAGGIISCTIVIENVP